MKYILTKKFKKDFALLPVPVKAKAVRTFEKFVKNPRDPALRRHELTGTLQGYFSINVTGDIRALYVYVEPDLVQFVAIGSHSKLYT